MLDLVHKIDQWIEPLRKLAATAFMPLLDLVIRLHMAKIFLVSGWQKFKSFLDDDWASTIFLFEDVHAIPGVPAEIAAVLGTGGELVLGGLLVAGLFTRFAGIGLIIMTLMIEFVVVSSFGDSFSNSDHYFWMLLLAVPVIYGPQKLSVDWWLLKGLRNQRTA